MEMFDSYVGDKPYIFVSYAHADSKEVLHIISQLHRENYRIWYDEGIPLMTEYTETLAEKIRNCEIFMIFLSKKSMGSIHVQQEIYQAYMSGKKF